MKFRIIFLYLTLIILNIPFHIFAQNDYREGFVITVSRDTLDGFLQYLSKSQNTIRFKKSLTDNAIEYSTNEISAFRFRDGKFFIAKNVNIGKGNQDYFLEYLIKGRANIYFIHLYEEHYFIERENDQLIELTQPDTLYFKTDELQSFRNKQTKGKMKYALRDCPEIFDDIDNINKLSHSGLIKLAKDYHDKTCTTEECIIFERKIKPVKIKTGFYVGGSAYKLTFGVNVKSNVSIGSNIGYRFEFLNFFPSNEHLSIIADLSVKAFNNCTLNQVGYYRSRIYYNGIEYLIVPPKDIDIITNQTLTQINVNLKTYALYLPLLVKQYYHFGKFKPYIGGGLGNMIVMSQNNKALSLDIRGYISSLIPLYQMGFIGKSGFSYSFKNSNSVFFEINYEYLQSMNINQSLNLKTNMLTFQLGYGF